MWKQEVTRKTWKKPLTLVAFGGGKYKCEVRCICSNMALSFGYTYIIFKLKKIKNAHLSHCVITFKQHPLLMFSIHIRIGLMKIVLNQSAPWKFHIGCECCLIDSCLVKRQFYLREYKLNQTRLPVSRRQWKISFIQYTLLFLFCLVTVLLLRGIECFMGFCCNLPESSPPGLLCLTSVPWRFKWVASSLRKC